MSDTTKRTATLVADKGRNTIGAHWKHYRLDPPLVDPYATDDDYNPVERSYEHVIVSANNVPYSGPETYVFGANETGEVVAWGELEGSFKGGLDHERALREAGYEVTS